MTPSLTPSLSDLISDPSNASLLASPAPKVSLAPQPAGVPMLRNLIGDQTPSPAPAPLVDNSGLSSLPPLPGTLRPLVTNPRAEQEQRLQSRIDAHDMPDPAQPGFWHAIGRVGAKIGNIIGNDFIPHTMAMIPGTDAYKEAQYDKDTQKLNSMQAVNETLANNLSKRNLEGAQTAHTQEETSEMPGEAQDKHDYITAQTYDLQHPQPKTLDEAWLANNPNATAKDLLDYQQAQAKAKNQKPSTPQQQTFDDLLNQGLTPIQAYEKIREKPGGTTINQGTWALDEDPTTGKPVLFNSKTGETKDAPAGVAKAGTFAKSQAATEPAKQALDYAINYGNMPVHTGPGDEALMEKFFELAKPSTGFRMSQQQMDMLKNAQSIMGGMEAHLRHMTTGTWFSDNQRKQIVSTMGDLARAKGLSVDSTGQPGGGSQSDGKPNASAQPSGGMIRAYDDKGIEHEAPAGTPLPKGWRLK